MKRRSRSTGHILFSSLPWFLHSVVTVGLATSPTLAQAADPVEFFEKKIRPIFADNCQGCHNPELKTGGLDLSTPEGFANGSQSGPIVSRDNPESSRLLGVVSYEEKLKMPPRMKLGDPQIAALRQWVMAGAPWPASKLRLHQMSESTSQNWTTLCLPKSKRTFGPSNP